MSEMFSVVSETFSFIRHIHTNTQHNTYNNTNTHRQTHTQTCFVSVQIVHQFLIWKRVKKRVFKLLFVSFSQWKRTWTEMWKYWNQPSVASVVKTLLVNSSQKKEYVHCLADMIIQNNISDFRNLSRVWLTDILIKWRALSSAHNSGRIQNFQKNSLQSFGEETFYTNCAKFHSDSTCNSGLEKAKDWKK